MLVKCINNDSKFLNNGLGEIVEVKPALTVGKVYEVKRVIGSCYQLISDNKKRGLYSNELFIVVE